MAFEQVRACNKYFDSQAPWQSIKTDVDACAATIGTCIRAIANLAVLMAPFLPFSAKVLEALGLTDTGWEMQTLEAGRRGKPGILFPNLDKEVIERELAKLGK